jgi:hypothetical protein
MKKKRLIPVLLLKNRKDSIAMDIRSIKRKIKEYPVRLIIKILIDKFFVRFQIIKPNAYFYHRLVFPFFKFIMTISHEFKIMITALAWENLYSNQNNNGFGEEKMGRYKTYILFGKKCFCRPL